MKSVNLKKNRYFNYELQFEIEINEFSDEIKEMVSHDELRNDIHVINLDTTNFYNNIFQKLIVTDRDFIEKSKKAFVSFIRSYKEHEVLILKKQKSSKILIFSSVTFSSLKT